MDSKQNNKSKKKTNNKRNKNSSVTNTLRAEDAKLDTIKEVPVEEEPKPQMGASKEEISELEAEDSEVEYDSEVEREERYYATLKGSRKEKLKQHAINVLKAKKIAKR